MKYKVLTRWFNTIENQFELNEIETENEQTAWEIVEESYSDNNNQNWLLDEKAFNELKNILK